ncbi:MAG: BRO family protein [Endozoicomonas sp.]|uniref:BRO family protein n=1 Tax=Endozoicomonas sp. TaxID=1892382 RepID=UPI003D9BF0F0
MTRYENAVEKDFNASPVQMIPHEDELWMTMESIGAGLEYEQPKRYIEQLYNRNKEELNEYSCVVKVRAIPAPFNTRVSGAPAPLNMMGADPTCTRQSDSAGQRRSVRVFNEKGVMILTMLSGQPKAREFRSWAVKVLTAYRNQELALSQKLPPDHDKFLEKMVIEAGKGNAMAYQVLQKKYGMEREIPPYVVCEHCDGLVNVDKARRPTAETLRLRGILN